MYIDKQWQKTIKGVKETKSKDHITMMVCIWYKGKKEPLALIGKAKKPKCFQLCPNETPPLPYKGQSNAWSDKMVMMWWIWNVFWPFHLKENGDVPTILLLDNFSGQTNLNKRSLPQNLEKVYFPEKVTNKHQPADIGTIANLKVGYKVSMLEMLLSILTLWAAMWMWLLPVDTKSLDARGFSMEGKPMPLMQWICLTIFGAKERVSIPQMMQSIAAGERLISFLQLASLHHVNMVVIVNKVAWQC